MNTLKKYHPVNWIDGMKISKNHFIQTDNFIIGSLQDRQNIFLTSYNFGLLPFENSTDSSLEIIINQYGSFIEIFLKKCNAITRGGARIIIDDHNQLQVTLSKPDNSINSYEIIIGVYPFERIPIGIPDNDEVPPRHPFTDVSYSLEISPSSHYNKGVSSNFQLVIGSIKTASGALEFNKKYIPPSSSIQGHPLLIKAYENFSNLFQNIYNLSLNVSKKIVEKNKPSSISTNYKVLSKSILDYNAGIYFQFRNILPNQPPIYLIDCFSTLANILYSNLYSISAEEREEILKYTFEWCDITPGDFEDILISTSKINYDHHFITESLEIVEKFLSTIDFIWTRINSLEFIGQRKENMVLTKEIVTQYIDQPKKRWSILD